MLQTDTRWMPGGRVGILGLAYKPETNVVEESQGVAFARYFLEQDVPVVVYDPAALDNARAQLKGAVTFASSAEDCARQAGTTYVPTLTVPDGYYQVAARKFERDRQPLACVDPATRAKALATDTVALAPRPTESALRDRAARLTTSRVNGAANLKRVFDAGIPVALGTDAGNPLTLHGASVFMELEAMQAAGLAPRDVLVAATRNAAPAMGLDSTGTVTAGAVADLLVLDGDPLADVRHFREIALVVRRGEVYTRHELAFSAAPL